MAETVTVLAALLLLAAGAVWARRIMPAQQYTDRTETDQSCLREVAGAAERDHHRDQ